MIKLRMDGGASNPSEIILSTLFATLVSTVVAIITCKLLQNRRYR
jgi:spore maturation protein A